MEDPSTLFAVLAAMALVATAVTSLVRGAQCHFSPSRLEHRLPPGGERVRLEAYLADQGRRRALVDLLGTIAQFAFVLGSYEAFRGWSPAAGSLPTALFASLAIGLLFFLGRLLPRRIGAQHADAIMARSLPWIDRVARVAGGLARPFVFLTDLVLAPLGVRAAAGGSLIEDAVLAAVADKEKEGLIREGEKEMIEGVIELKGVDVSTVMTPRTEMTMLDLSRPAEQGIRAVIECGYSRVPVHGGNPDEIVGVLYVKDLLQYWGRTEPAAVPIESILRRPFFVPETQHIAELLREFQTMKIHIAIVLDEYGGTAGLVTIEDILEEIVGEIADEYDPVRDSRLRVLGDSQADVDARVRIDELNETFDLALPEGDGFETLGGFIVHSLGRIPAAGEDFDWEGVRFTVLSADERRIHRVQVRLGAAAEGK